MKNIVVFGGSGFLGSHVCDELSKCGHNVTVFDKHSSKYLKLNQRMVVGDILNKNAVDQAIKNQDIVFHLAAIADLHQAKLNPGVTAETNIIGTLNILSACKKYKIKRVMFSSTVYVYSNHGSFYRVSKQSCELFLEAYSKEFELDYTILRYGSLYGSRSNKFNFIRNIIKEALTSGTMTRKGNGEETRAYINIMDAARASVDALDKKYKNTCLMITGSQSIKVKEMMEIINEIFSNKLKINFIKGKNDGHYTNTPYVFKPNVAKKIQLSEYYELGQGLLENIYEIKQELIDSDVNTIDYEEL